MESVAVVIAIEDMSAVRKKRISLSLSLFFLAFFSFARVVGVFKRVSVSVMCREKSGSFVAADENEKSTLQILRKN